MEDSVKSIAANRAVAAVRRTINRAGFDITRQPFDYRFVEVLHGQGIGTIIDIGANTGQFALDMRAARFTGDIYSVEPLGTAYAELSRRAVKDARWHTDHLAVSDTEGRIDIHVSSNSVSSSALPMLDSHALAAPGSVYVDTETVDATTVDALVARHAIDPATTLLKVDVQGFESAVLDGAGGTLTSFAAVQLELSLVPLYEGSSLMPDLVARMSGHGFDLWLIEPAFFEPATGRMLQCDGTFFRR